MTCLWCHHHWTVCYTTVAVERSTCFFFFFFSIFLLIGWCFFRTEIFFPSNERAFFTLNKYFSKFNLATRSCSRSVVGPMSLRFLSVRVCCIHCLPITIYLCRSVYPFSTKWQTINFWTGFHFDKMQFSTNSRMMSNSKEKQSSICVIAVEYDGPISKSKMCDRIQSAVRSVLGSLLLGQFLCVFHNRKQTR